ncbi:MAG: DUF5615 family PIN-like protein [Bryobacteraceae bacterium]
MRQFTLYIDEDAIDRELVGALRQRGVRVVTPLEEKLVGSTDEEQLIFAYKRGCVLYTFNVSDFYALHTRWLAAERRHAGLILAPQQRYSVGEQLRRILRLRASKSAEAMGDCAEFLSKWG